MFNHWIFIKVKMSKRNCKKWRWDLGCGDFIFPCHNHLIVFFCFWRLFFDFSFFDDILIYPRFILCWIISNESCSVNVYSRRRNESRWQDESGQKQHDERGDYWCSNVVYPRCWINWSTQYHFLRPSQNFINRKNQRCNQVWTNSLF